MIWILFKLSWFLFLDELPFSCMQDREFSNLKQYFIFGFFSMLYNFVVPLKISQTPREIASRISYLD